MSYKAERLIEIFGKRHSAKVTAQEASRLAGHPEAIAERVYGLGNPSKASELGNTNAGDGFRYRGGGLMQTTGRANYRRMGEKSGVEFEDHPELILSSEHALKPALIEWTEQKLNAFADADDLLAISRAINLGNTRTTRTPIGLAERREWLRKTRTQIGDSVTFARASATVDSSTPPQAPDGADFSLREIQVRLKDMALYLGEIDGVYGTITQTAIAALFMNQGVRETADWTQLRFIIGAAQLLCRIDGIEVGPIDGFLGPRTQQAFETYNARRQNNGHLVPSLETWRDGETSDDTGAVTPAEAPPEPASTPSSAPAPNSANAATPEATAQPAAASQPSSTISAPSITPSWPRESGVAAFFGAPGSNQVTLVLPFRMRLAWDLRTTVTKTSCNKKVRENLERIWKRTLDHYGFDEIQRLRLDLFGGCLNVRKKRGGSGWSMHAYGIAWDVDPEHNQLKMGRDDASLDGSEYEKFWEFVYDEGAIGLGREHNYDWMHFQFARL